MSHFTVMVIGADYAKQLATYHEFECTGVVDEYVQSINELDGYKKGYAEGLVHRNKAPDGSLHDPYDDCFYRDPTPDEAKELGHCIGTCGNAVPPAAAKAIAEVMGTTLLLSWSGETFVLSSTPVWVRPAAIVLSLSQGAM